MAMPDMKELMEKAKEMQGQMQKAQQEITAIKVTGESGGGMVKVQLNGAHRALRVEISPTLLDEDEQETLEDLIAAAINSASDKIEESTKQKMTDIAKDMKLPEGMGDVAGGGDTGTGGGIIQ
jgi:nucleoid-associated protein EbfC